MPGSLERIRKSMDVQPTAQGKGLRLTLHVTAYDNGMVEVDGIPINVSPSYDPAVGWMGASEVVVATLHEFLRQSQARARTLKQQQSKD
jgi:hypothetical protein